MKLITSLFLATTLFAQAEVKVTVGDISDKRTTGQFFSGLEIDLKLSGPELAACKGLRVVLKEAKDDTGQVVPAEEDRFNEGGFSEPQKAFGNFGGDSAKKDELQVKLQLKNPARAAKTLTVDGTVELLVPSKDPAAVVSSNVAKEAGKPLVNDALKAAGVSITLNAAKDRDVGYSISDPGKKVASVEFCRADGKALETGGRMSSGFGGKKDVTVTLQENPPADLVAKIYLVTAKSMVSVPVKLSAIALP